MVCFVVQNSDYQLAILLTYNTSCPNSVLLSILYRNVARSHTVALEGLAGLLATDLLLLTKACGESRLEARQSAARDSPDLAKRGIVRADPLSSGLFSQLATDVVFAALPAITSLSLQQAR